jgi:arginine/lysine/ornithine decarboxylase
MALTHDQAPIVEALASYLGESFSSFGVPGHKGGKGAPADIYRLLGRYAFYADTTTQHGVDDRTESKKVLHKAESLAARAWGAKRCLFSTNGSSLSNHAVLLATANPGDTVLVSRNSHKSMIAALIIGGVRPVFLTPDYDPDWNVEHGIPVAEVERQLDAHPDAKGVFVVSPSFYGVTSDLKRIAKACHKRGVPLVVDEAWGPHYPFHPDMPTHALRCGADIAITSIHKTMAGLHQASILLWDSEIIPEDRFALCYDLFESTSPSVPILASIDATRRQFVKGGKDLLETLLKHARRAREEIGAIEGVRVMGKEILDGDARHEMEETKILLDVAGLRVSGYEADDYLSDEHKVSMGLSDEQHLLATFTIGNGRRDTNALISALQSLADWARDRTKRHDGVPKDLPRHDELGTKQVMTPSEAFFAPSEFVPLKRAAGRISSAMISPYPPGVPRVLPGERITESHIAYFEIARAAGMFPMDANDRTLREVRVVAGGKKR